MYRGRMWPAGQMFETPILTLQQTLRLLRPGNVFPILYFVTSVFCSVLFCSYNPSTPRFNILHIQRCSSAYCGSIGGYLSYCCLPISSKQLCHCPLTSEMNNLLPHSDAWFEFSMLSSPCLH